MTTIADPRDIIMAPVISEKSYGLLDRNWYTFLVHPDANKTQIKIAIQQIFNVRVLTVNTSNREGKRKRTRTGWGQRKATKRALVKLADGDRIEAFGGPVG
jgi:large subunit ribosomal protein L23